MKMNYEDLSLSDEPIKKERALCQKGFTEAWGARKIAEQVLGQLTVADSFHYLYHCFGKPTSGTEDEYKISYEYVLRYKGCMFLICGTTPEFVYIDCYMPKRYQRIQYRRYVDEVRKIFTQALESDVLLYPYYHFKTDVLTKYQQKKWDVLFDKKAREYFDAETYAMLDNVDWPSLSDERRKELYDKYMKSFEKHLLDKFWEWGNNGMKEVLGVPSLHFLPEIEQIVGEFCELLLAPYLIRDCSINIQGWDSNSGSIRLSWKDYSFLKELQHELNTQTNDGNADPVYWGVIETREEPAPEDCGEARIYNCDGDGSVMTLDEVVRWVEDRLEDRDLIHIWDTLDRDDIDTVLDFIHDEMGIEVASVVWTEEHSRVSEDTGAFLTKRACQEYISKFGYNHSHPHTYAMTAYRNFELERLLKILKCIDFKSKPSVNVIESEWEWGTSIHITSHDGKALAKLTIDNKDRDEGFIYDVNTHADVRQSGYATMILDKAELEAKQHSVKRLYLWVERGSWMEAWYRRRGFVDEDFMEPPSESTLWLVKFLK